MSSEQKPLNFYFGSLKDSGIIEKAPTEYKYIILQNDELHKKLDKLKKNFNELQKEKEELEEDNGSLETSKTSLKGYINNQIEYNILSKKLVLYYNKEVAKIETADKKLVWNTKVNISSLLVFELAIVIMKIFIYGFASISEVVLINILFFYLIFCVHEDYKKLIQLKHIENNEFVTKTKLSMIEVEKGNEYLRDLVDIV